MTTISIELPESIFSALRKDPHEFTQELRLVAAIKWYELGQITQGQAAQIAGLNRAEFINILSRYQVSTFQYTPEEIEADLQSINESSY
jgi:predicted HTH domain antitoxin